MAPQLTSGEKKIIYKFYAHFKREAQHGYLFRSVDKFAQRVLDVVGICRKSLYNIVKEVENSGLENNSKRQRSEKFDGFDKQVVACTACDFFDKNKTLNVKRFKIALRTHYDYPHKQIHYLENIA